MDGEAEDWANQLASDVIGKCLSEKYDVISTLGVGGFGAVFKVQHRATRRQFAIKVLSPSFALDAKKRERFDREAMAAGGIVHDHIAEVIDTGNLCLSGQPFGGVSLPYLVMPLLVGETLEQRLERSGALEPYTAVDITRQLLSALEAVHSQPLPIIHRDLKPANVFLTTVSDRRDFVKLLDFGIAKVPLALTEEGELGKLTKTGEVFGSPEYMSPEQVTNENVDHRADLWASGAILFRMLSGRTVFEASTWRQQIVARLTMDAPLLRTVAPHVTKALEDIVATALQRDPAARFQSAQKMSDALRQCRLREFQPIDFLLLRMDAELGSESSRSVKDAHDFLEECPVGTMALRVRAELCIHSKHSKQWAAAIEFLEQADAIARADGDHEASQVIRKRATEVAEEWHSSMSPPK